MLSKSSSSPYISESKLSKQKKTVQSTPNPSQYQQIITVEIEKARLLIDSFQCSSASLEQKQKHITVEDLRQIQRNIDRKNNIIKQLEEDIVLLKNRYKDINQTLDNKINNIIMEIRVNYNHISQLQNKIKDCRKNNQKYVAKINNVYQKYANKCKQQSINIVEFKKFKNMENDKKKQDPTKFDKFQDNSKKKLSYIVQNNHISRKTQQQNQQKIPTSEPRTIAQSLARRSVAETALKNQRKKHRKEVSNLMSKIQFLKDEDNDLEIKIQSKLIQLENAQKKFTQHYKSHLSVNRSVNQQNKYNNNVRNNDNNVNSNRKVSKMRTIN